MIAAVLDGNSIHERLAETTGMGNTISLATFEAASSDAAARSAPHAVDQLNSVLDIETGMIKHRSRHNDAT